MLSDMGRGREIFLNTQASNNLEQGRMLRCAQFLGERTLDMSSPIQDSHKLLCPAYWWGLRADSCPLIPAHTALTYRAENYGLWSPFCQQSLPSCTVVPGASEMAR